MGATAVESWMREPQMGWIPITDPLKNFQYNLRRISRFCPSPVSPIYFPTFLSDSPLIFSCHNAQRKITKNVAKVGGDQIHLAPIMSKVGGDTSHGWHCTSVSDHGRAPAPVTGPILNENEVILFRTLRCWTMSKLCKVVHAWFSYKCIGGMIYYRFYHYMHTDAYCVRQEQNIAEVCQKLCKLFKVF